MNIFTLAARNLTRRHVRTSLTVAGVAIAIAVLFSLLSFNAGYERQQADRQMRQPDADAHTQPL